jgi:hypothetical protein
MSPNNIATNAGPSHTFNMTIPKIIFQTSPRACPDHIRDTFYSLAPDWKYLHYTDYEILEFFDRNPSAEFPKIREKFNAFDRGEHKADLFRYYFLYLNGGLFIDSDAIPHVSLSQIAEQYSYIFTLPLDSRTGIFNGIIGAIPKSPLIYEALNHCYHTPPELLDPTSYHYFCKTLKTLIRIHQPENTIFYQEVDMLGKGLQGSIVVDQRGTRFFTHYWSLGYVPRKDIGKPNDSVVRKLLNRVNKSRPGRITSRAFKLARQATMSTIAKGYRQIRAKGYKRKFSEVYASNKWEFGSGSGSLPSNTGAYNDFIVKLLTTLGATQVTDIGCGDWQSTHLIYDKLGPIDYLGIDCVTSVINANKAKHPRYSFKCIDFVENPEQIRDSEVYIIKDVLQHLETEDIYATLDELTRRPFKYIIITNYGFQHRDNENLPDKDEVAKSRGLSAKLYPLKKYGAVQIFNYFGGDDKEISIIVNRTHWNHVTADQTWALNLEVLRVWDTGSRLQRLGPDSDGGYVIYPGLQYDLFISCGISDDIRFELSFLRANPGIKCIAFDGTIDSLPNSDQPIEFRKRNIAAFPRSSESDLTEVLQGASNVFLKMDIEGSEFDWIACASLDTMNKFAQIVIEVHWPFDQFRAKALAKIAATHCPIHIHGNNYNSQVIPKHLPSGRSYDGTVTIRDSDGRPIKFPEVFEVTYLRKDLMPSGAEPIRKSFPTELDSPNCPNIPDIEFSI